MDFLRVSTRATRKDRFEVYPKFVVRKTKDLMVKGGDFYAFWDETKKSWSTDQDDLIAAIDRELDDYYEEHKDTFPGGVYICHLWDSESGSIDRWHHYVQKQMHENYRQLDDSIVFLNDPWERDLYSSHRLPYAKEAAPTPNYDKLMTTLYSDEERTKIEWAFGAIVEGDSKWIQKFLVLTGAPGTGKSTVLRILEQLFEGYSQKIDSSAIGKGKDFAFETIAANPLVAFEDEANLSKIQENAGLNSLVAHEELTVNKKFAKQYTQKFHTFIFLCSNSYVNITDSKSGLIRRLIDVEPTGNKLPVREYNAAFKGVKFELGGIAEHCHQVYLENKHLYDDYVPTRMMRSTNVVYSWLEENYDTLVENDGISLTQAWAQYKQFCDECDIQYRLNRMQLQNELSGYFHEFIPDGYVDDKHVRSYYLGFISKKFKNRTGAKKPKPVADTWLKLNKKESIFDDEFADRPAQYATQDEIGKPIVPWDQNDLTLKDLKTTRLHYVRPPKNLIVIDFDLKNEGGGKDYALNMEAASKWPETYAELSKSEAGIHLHYWYNGNISDLDSLVEPGIEVKTFGGKSSLRRMLTWCNDIPIATITSGLPIRKEKKQVVDMMTFRSQRHLIGFIAKQLRKETHADTHSSVSFIKKALDDAYESGMPYSIPEDLREAIRIFASQSTNHAQDCLKMVKSMKWESDAENPEDLKDDGPEKPIAFFDIEVFPNLLLVCWKEIGKECLYLVNPEPSSIEYLFETYRLIGFNCRKYDNHILYARFMGYSVYQCYLLSKAIVSSTVRDSDKKCFFREAYNKSYTDIYEYSIKKQSLKKWEIELGKDHKELEHDWNAEVTDEELYLIIEYCKNDVEATEAVFFATESDFRAVEILAKAAGMSVNSSKNSLTTAIIFNKEKGTRDSLRWRDLSKPVAGWTSEATRAFLQDEVGRFIEPFDDKSVLPYFPGYEFKDGTSTYRGYEVGEGGFVYAEPGMYTNVALIDVESMHPNSFVDEVYAGVKYTRRFLDLLNLRVAIKHKDFESARKMFGGIFAEYLDDERFADDLSNALKISINSVYGLTSAKFENAFYNPQNRDNIVAKRGALFMIDLLYSVQEMGLTVAHIKTDSIKIPGATLEDINRVKEIGRRYGYVFDHEATYEKMCLVNNAVYIARYLDKDTCLAQYGYIPSKQKFGKWTATGTQFAVPYVFKTLFSHEPIEFDDLCEIKSVTTAIYIDMDPDGEHDYKFVGRCGKFTPVKVGGGILVRKSADKYNSVTGSKGYLWMESKDAEVLPPEIIDHEYYVELVNDAKDTISKYGDLEWFVA